MQFIRTEVPESIIVEPDVYHDTRGFFLETYHERKYVEGGIEARFVQDNYSCSEYGVLRGLHLQVNCPQAKLIRVVRGEIFDVAVDVRRDSPTFSKWVGVTLSSDNHRQFFCPAGFAHGFCVLSQTAEVAYKCDAFYDRSDEVSIRWNDPMIGVKWPIEDPTLSQRDREAMNLEEFLEEYNA